MFSIRYLNALYIFMIISNVLKAISKAKKWIDKIKSVLPKKGTKDEEKSTDLAVLLDNSPGASIELHIQK